MRLCHVFFALSVLLGTVNVKGQETSTNSTTRRYEWDSPEADEEADAASEQVRADWTEALAEYNPFEELTNLEKLQLYNEWKAEAWHIVNNYANARFKLHKSVHPKIKFYNTFAPKDACPTETAAFIDRLGRAMNGILSSSELDDDQDWLVGSNGDTSSGSGGRKLRGDRKLSCTCPGCPKVGPYCNWICGCRRRRLDIGSDEIRLNENTPENMEALVSSVSGVLQEQCEKRLKDIGTFSGTIDLVCANTLKAIKCEVVVDVWEVISVVIDGVERLAADMIEEKLLAGSGSV